MHFLSQNQQHQSVLLPLTAENAHLPAVHASCAMYTADKSSYSAEGTLHPYHFSPLTHQSLTITFTLNVNVIVVNTAFFMIFAVFNLSPLTVCINYSFFYIDICCFITSFEYVIL